MGQGGQGQGSVDPTGDRIAAVAQRIVDARKVTEEVEADVTAITEGNPPPNTATTDATLMTTATVPDVAGKDITAMNTPAPVPVTESIPEELTSFYSPAEVHADFSADVQLVRDQLGQVVTNFRSRIDSIGGLVDDHDGVLKALATKVEGLVKTAADHSSQIEALVSALEAIK